MKTRFTEQHLWRTRLRCLVGVFFVLTYVTANATSAFAMTSADKKSFRDQQDILYSGDCDAKKANGGTGTSPSGAGANCEAKPLPDSVPEYWRNLIDETAKQYPDVDRRTVAAELWVENRGWPDPNKNWAVSGAGAQGPWQFIPSTWASMATDGDGDGVMDPNNPKDEVHAAFKHNKGTACKPILEGATGDAQSDYDNVPFQRDGTSTLMSSIANYNGRGAQDGVAIGKQTVGDENSDYVKMAYWLIATDFKQSIDPKTGQMVDATTAGAAANSAVNTAVGNSGANKSDECEDSSAKSAASGSTASGNGASSGTFANPLPTGQLTECYDGRGGSHKAIDLSDTSGSGAGGPALASDGGTVSMVNDGDYGGFGKTVIIKHENGYYTRYSHLDSISVKQGDKVAKGDKVGVTGNTGKSFGTHLDFGISKDPGVPNNGSAEDPLKFIDRNSINGAAKCP